MPLDAFWFSPNWSPVGTNRRVTFVSYGDFKKEELEQPLHPRWMRFLGRHEPQAALWMWRQEEINVNSCAWALWASFLHNYHPRHPSFIRSPLFRRDSDFQILDWTVYNSLVLEGVPSLSLSGPLYNNQSKLNACVYPWMDGRMDGWMTIMACPRCAMWSHIPTQFHI